MVSREENVKELPPQLSKKEQQEAERFGGCDVEDYTTPDGKLSCDKENHRRRSEMNQPNHLRHTPKIVLSL